MTILNNAAVYENFSVHVSLFTLNNIIGRHQNSNMASSQISIHLPNQETRLATFKKIDSDRTTNVDSLFDNIEDCEPQKFQSQNIFLKSLKTIRPALSCGDIALCKLGNFGVTTSRADKMVRLSSSLIKVGKAYSWLSYTCNKPAVDRLSTQLNLTRKVFQFNSKWLSLKQLIQGIPAARTKSDFLSLFFKTFQLASSLNEFFLVLIQIKAVLLRGCVRGYVERINSDFYFIQCLILLCLHTRQFVKMRREVGESRKIHGFRMTIEMAKLHHRKLWTILKYICDCYTSHNNFSHRFFVPNAKKVAILGTISSLIGFNLAWNSFH